MCIMCSRFQQVAGPKRHIKLPFCISAAPVVALGWPAADGREAERQGAKGGAGNAATLDRHADQKKSSMGRRRCRSRPSPGQQLVVVKGGDPEQRKVGAHADVGQRQAGDQLDAPLARPGGPAVCAGFASGTRGVRS
mgnify:CR=1 FL=1